MEFNKKSYIESLEVVGKEPLAGCYRKGSCNATYYGTDKYVDSALTTQESLSSLLYSDDAPYQLYP